MRRVIILISAVTAVLIIVGIGSLLLSKRTAKEKIENISKDGALKEAEGSLEKNNFLEAKELYVKAANEISDLNKLEAIKDKIAEINMKILFSPVMDEGSLKYVVQPNDALAKIAKRFNTTVELIKRANNLESDIIIPGQELKVNNSKFAIAIDKSQNILFLKRNDEVIKKYVVSTGKDNSSPVGSFRIVNRLSQPTWFKTGAVISPDSPENILGSRWMGFDIKGYGVHGTITPDQIGQQVTLGCIRMKNEEVEELYDVIPVGTEVDIVD